MSSARYIIKRAYKVGNKRPAYDVFDAATGITSKVQREQVVQMARSGLIHGVTAGVDGNLYSKDGFSLQDVETYDLLSIYKYKIVKRLCSEGKTVGFVIEQIGTGQTKKVKANDIIPAIKQMKVAFLYIDGRTNRIMSEDTELFDMSKVPVTDISNKVQQQQVADKYKIIGVIVDDNNEKKILGYVTVNQTNKKGVMKNSELMMIAKDNNVVNARVVTDARGVEHLQGDLRGLKKVEGSRFGLCDRRATVDDLLK